MNNDEFRRFLLQKGEELYRDMPWRNDTRPYYVLVSELMLQQTQVSRVVPKFEAFIATFPDVNSLAQASLADVLVLWQGLGYNRRAKFLHEAAKLVVADFDGTFPVDERDLLRLPGVGKNTAGAIRAYVFNQPSVFIETNVRTVYIHHFFNNQFDIDDTKITERLKATMDTEDPRRFYWAVMDYGSWLKAQGVKNISASKHYKKQAALKGSLRETRGAIIRALSQKPHPLQQLEDEVAMEDRFASALEGLMADGLVQQTGAYFHLTK